jgi:cell division protein FtsI (penicillin-binding protein 3)
VASIWVNPQYCREAEAESEDPKSICSNLTDIRFKQAAKLLGMSLRKLLKAFDASTNKQFVYLKRHIEPSVAAEIKALGLPGVGFIREFKRFYPAGEVAAHLVGFTNIDDKGQEGLELMYNSSLKGVAGSKRVIRDGKRRIIEGQNLEGIKEPVNGQDLQLSIDERLQYLAYKELKAGVVRHRAKSASLVMLEAETGNVLAVVNQPSFNPNVRKNLKVSRYRNRAITDIFEPGSTMKPLVVAAALEGGFIKPNQLFDTRDFKIKGRWVRDGHKHGTMDLTAVLKKSSNVAASKIALSMPPSYFWRFYHDLGFGVSPRVNFPSSITKEADFALCLTTPAFNSL